MLFANSNNIESNSGNYYVKRDEQSWASQSFSTPEVKKKKHLQEIVIKHITFEIMTDSICKNQ